jgi:hypothetical protein
MLVAAPFAFAAGDKLFGRLIEGDGTGLLNVLAGSLSVAGLNGVVGRS